MHYTSARVPTIVGLVLLCAGCESPAAAPTPQVSRPRFTYDQSCRLSEELCRKIDSGITHLEKHGNLNCVVAGNQARLLFEHPDDDYGFAPGNGGVYDMYVLMAPGNCSSGECRIGNQIFVNRASSNAKTVGGLIAHELEHWNGAERIDEGVGIADSRQRTCEI